MKEKLTDIVFAITEICSSRCLYCFYEKNIKCLGEEHAFSIKNILTVKEIKNVIDQAIPLGLKRIQISGGEALLQKKTVLEVISYSSKKGIQSSLFTNGYLANKDTIIQLKKAGLNIVRISLGGYDYETHSIERKDPRGEKDWESIVKAFHNFKKEGIIIKSFIPITKRSLSCFAETVKFAIEELDVDEAMFHKYIPSGIKEQDKLYDLSPEEHYRAIDIFLDLKKKYGLKIRPNHSFFHYLSPEWKEEQTYPALCGINRLGIFHDGSMGTCSCPLDRIIGNIRNKDFNLEKIWKTDPKLTEIRNIKSQEYVPCISCKYKDDCRPCRSFNLGKDKQASLACPAVREYNLLRETLKEDEAIKKSLRHNFKD